MKQKLILGILFLLFPISPWIWKAFLMNNNKQCTSLIQTHIKVMILVWICIAFLFGFYGGQIIGMLATFY